ncbi:MAG: hypothetical protein QG612_2639 [Pseudomonadota bacterium]|nr:hypothetical protein [Pseudomonadota bacterium]
MDSDLFSFSFRRVLPRGHATWLRRPHEGVMQVSVQAGRLWLTQSGDPDDHFIAAGEDWVLCGPGEVVVESDGEEMAVFSLRFGAEPQAPSASTCVERAAASATRSVCVGVGG